MVAALLLWGVPLLAGDQAPKKSDEQKKCFVDFDGDGFDDNALDDDLDGIPNDVDPDYVKPKVETQAESQLDDFFALDDMAPVSTLDLLSNAQKFCRLRMSVRALAQSRGAFEESNEFGVGEGIGAGAVMGGVCQGGVCVPH
jgi:hypothetical protein